MTEPVSTGCNTLDALLGGGFERGTVAQLYGPPAAGKTHIALSAAVRAASSRASAPYIHIEGFSVDRLQQLIEHSTDDALDTVASRLIITDAVDFDEQQEAVRDAADFAERVELIVLDSATGFYRLNRAGDEEGGDSLRAVARQITELLSIARKHDIAVVVTNQVYTDPDADRVRALGGHTLEHWTGVVVRLDRFRGGKRRATLEKHRAKAAGETATFEITDGGITGVDEL